MTVDHSQKLVHFIRISNLLCKSLATSLPVDTYPSLRQQMYRIAIKMRLWFVHVVVSFTELLSTSVRYPAVYSEFTSKGSLLEVAHVGYDN